jgi:hypothetical protein
MNTTDISNYPPIAGNQKNEKRRELIEYVLPAATIMGVKEAKPAGLQLEDRNVQVIVAREENRAALCELLIGAWYPYRYEVIAVEDLNAIAVGHDESKWNTEDAVEAGEFFIIDMSRVESQRARSGFGVYDDAALVRFIKTNMEYKGSKVLVVMDRRQKVVERAYPEFWAFAHGNGIEVFDRGKYRSIGGKI